MVYHCVKVDLRILVYLLRLTKPRLCRAFFILQRTNQMNNQMNKSFCLSESIVMPMEILHFICPWGDLPQPHSVKVPSAPKVRSRACVLLRTHRNAIYRYGKLSDSCRDRNHSISPGPCPQVRLQVPGGMLILTLACYVVETILV